MTIGPLAPFNTIDGKEIANVLDAMKRGPLSGYLGGKLRSDGYWVNRLEKEWTYALRTGIYSIACNSATSALLAACAAAGIGPGKRVAVPCFTMSATAAAPALLGAELVFMDVDEYFCADPSACPDNIDAAIVTNLFGHPAQLPEWRHLAGQRKFILIEDNAQAPFAEEGESYTGTKGHIGCWSLNIHKALQAGEGGICTTRDEKLADKIRLFCNHGEMTGERVGLNLRMTELTAAIACAQLERSEKIIRKRIEQAEAIIEAIIGKIDFLHGPFVRPGCRHVYYTIPFTVDRGIDRRKFVAALQKEGVPLVEGYVDPLYRLPAFSAFKADCPVAERLHDKTLFYFENCSWSPTSKQIRGIGDAFQKVAERLTKSARAISS